MGELPVRMPCELHLVICGASSGGDHHGLADLPQPETVALLPERMLGPLDRLGHRLPAQMKGLMMHRDEHTRACRVRHGHRLLRRAVIADPRIVGADRHHRGIERAEAPMGFECARPGSVSADQQLPPFALHDETGVAPVDVTSDARPQCLTSMDRTSASP